MKRKTPEPAVEADSGPSDGNRIWDKETGETVGEMRKRTARDEKDSGSKRSS